MSDLTGCLPDLVDAYNALSAYLAGQGITTGIADDGGFRTEADTTRILGYRLADYNKDHGLPLDTVQSTSVLNQYRPIAPYGESFHDFGAAFDLAIVARPSGMSQYAALAMAGAYAPQIGLRWGGEFENPDPPHFELDVSLATAQDLYTQATGDTSAQDASGTGGTSSAMDLLLIGLMAATVGAIVWVARRRRSLVPA
jgi:hypothetical protein